MDFPGTEDSGCVEKKAPLATRLVKNANPVSRLIAVTVLAAAGLMACGKQAGAQAAKPESVKTVADYFPIKVGDKTVRMQLAVHSAEMQRGLMGRRDLGRDDGMLFVYEKTQQMSFWMRNTPTPLDIGFFNREGVLQEVYPLHPFDEQGVASTSTELQFALEMNQGWFRDNRVKPGAKLDLKALTAALKARGLQPRKFGLEE